MKTEYDSRASAVKKGPRDKVPRDGAPVRAFDGHTFPWEADIVTINKSGPYARFFFISPAHRAGSRRGVLLCASR